MKDKEVRRLLDSIKRSVGLVWLENRKFIYKEKGVFDPRFENEVIQRVIQEIGEQRFADFQRRRGSQL